MMSRQLRALALLGGLALAGHAAAQSEWKAFANPAGQMPEPLRLPQLDGTPLDLADLKGEVVLLNFWAAWCEPCRDEMPGLNRLHQTFAGRKFRVVSINAGDGRGAINRFLDSVPVDFAVLRDAESELMKRWRVRMLPASFLVDRKGLLRYQLLGAANWDAPALRAPVLELLDQER